MSVGLKQFREHYDTSMQEMFPAVSDLYAQYWGGFFHFAVLEDEQQSWEDAFWFCWAYRS
jgi:hypothetical protein